MHEAVVCQRPRDNTLCVSMCVSMCVCVSYLSRGGSLRARDPGMVSPPLPVTPATPAGGCVPSGCPALALLGGAWDLERRSFLSRSKSPPTVGSLWVEPRLAGLARPGSAGRGPTLKP